MKMLLANFVAAFAYAGVLTMLTTRYVPPLRQGLEKSELLVTLIAVVCTVFATTIAILNIGIMAADKITAFDMQTILWNVFSLLSPVWLMVLAAILVSRFIENTTLRLDIAKSTRFLIILSIVAVALVVVTRSPVLTGS